MADSETFEQRKILILKQFLSQILSIKDNKDILLQSLTQKVSTSQGIDKLCTLLGHPRIYIGKSIPEGKCCQPQGDKVKIVDLLGAPLNTWLTITIVNLKNPKIFYELEKKGIFPGQLIKILQKDPYLILENEHGQMMVDKKLATDILTW